MKKKIFYSELAYVIGLIFLAFGTSLIEKASFGMSMIVSPAYILHLEISQYFKFFTFGMAEYCFQGLLIIILSLILRKFRFSFLFSFVTAVIYGFLLDGSIFAVSGIPSGGFPLRIFWFVVGICMTTFGISLLFNTYISPEAYELFVKKVSEKYNLPIFKVKYAYDISSLILSVALSLIFFASFEGIGYGTVISALVNGKLISAWSKTVESRFTFVDGLKLRKYFED